VAVAALETAWPSDQLGGKSTKTMREALAELLGTIGLG
jgi:hypothetical protein